MSRQPVTGSVKTGPRSVAAFSSGRFSAALICAAVTAALVLGSSATVSAATLELTGPAGASVTINGRAVGFFPLKAAIELTPGRWEISSELPGYKPFRQVVRIIEMTEWRRLVVRLTPYSRRTAWSSNLLLAGMGQFYLGHRARGWLYAVAEIGGLATAVIGETGRGSAREDHLLLLEHYGETINADEIETLRLAADAKYQDMQDAENLRDMGLMVSGAAVALSILDALIAFPSVDVGAGPVPPTADPDPEVTSSDVSSLHAALRLKF